jgi:predicted  nucleic acid-binding Zn-ribbon protein
LGGMLVIMRVSPGGARGRVFARKVSMGPTNVALVQLYRADQALREAEERLDSASRSVRVQERRINELAEKLKLAQTQLREQQARGGQLDLDIKARDAKIERYREQQQNAKNHKEYQAFLTEINTEKIDKVKVEDEYLKVMEQAEKTAAEVKDLAAQLEGERKKNEETRGQLSGRLAELQAEIDRLRPVREAAAKGVSPKGLAAFERLVERFEGEVMAAIQRPDRRREEYVCTACNMSLVADVYNRLHSRDDLVPCPNCHRLLYIPEDMTPERAINKPKVRKEKPGGRGIGAISGRQVSAIDVARSIGQEEEEEEGGASNGAGAEAGADAAAAASDTVPPQQ